MTLLADPNAHAWAMSAFSRILAGDHQGAEGYLNRLTDDQRDEAMAAGTVLVALAGGLTATVAVPDGVEGYAIHGRLS